MQLSEGVLFTQFPPTVTSYMTTVQYQNQESDMETRHRRESDYPSLTHTRCVHVRGVFSSMQL